MKLEELIFTNLIHSEDYARQALPHLKSEYFHDVVERKIFNIIDTYVGNYNKPPTREAVIIELSNSDGLSEDQFKSAKSTINELPVPEK